MDVVEIGWQRGLPVAAVAVADVVVYSLALPLFPAVLGDHGEDEVVWLWMQGLSNLSAALTGSWVGRLSDEFGRKLVLMGSQVVSVLCSLLLVAGSGTRDHGIRLSLLSLGFILRKTNRTFPLCCALITDLSQTPNDKKLWLSRLGASFGIGFAAGPLITGFLSRHLGSVEILLVGLAIGVLNLACVGMFFPGQGATKVVPHKVSWKAIAVKCKEREIATVLCIHILSCFAQFLYITSVGVAARAKFMMDTDMYSMLVSYFGITYSLAMAFVVPRLSEYFKGDEQTMLCVGLALTSVMRLGVAMIPDVITLFLFHAIISVGTATINLVLTNLISRAGKMADITGSMVGLQDSIHRFSGVLAPALLTVVPSARIEETLGYPVYVGSLLSGIFYLLALSLCYAVDLSNLEERRNEKAE